MKSEEDARALAQVLIDIAHGMGKNASALITDMNQPLGRAVGNSLEVIEAFEALKGTGPTDFIELCRELAAEMLVMGRAASDVEQGRALYDQLIGSGAAVAKMREVIEAQSGDPRVVDDYALLPGAANQQAVSATVAGYVQKIDAEAVGHASMLLGAGRARLESAIDHGVGLIVDARIGDKIPLGRRWSLCIQRRARSRSGGADHSSVPDRARACRSSGSYQNGSPLIWSGKASGGARLKSQKLA